jgi:hypothetical protein
MGTDGYFFQANNAIRLCRIRRSDRRSGLRSRPLEKSEPDSSVRAFDPGLWSRGRAPSGGVGVRSPCSIRRAGFTPGLWSRGRGASGAFGAGPRGLGRTEGQSDERYLEVLRSGKKRIWTGSDPNPTRIFTDAGAMQSCAVVVDEGGRLYTWNWNDSASTPLERPALDGYYVSRLATSLLRATVVAAKRAGEQRNHCFLR